MPIIDEINKKYSNAVKDVKYVYLLREDETVDINIIVEPKDGSKYKYYVTVSYEDNILETDVEFLEGNKEESIIKYLIQ